MMELWRISNYADLRGIGGLRAPGRWHFAGQPVVYLAEHPASALLEILVHQNLSHSEQVPDSYQLLRVEVPDDIAVAELREADTPENWRADPQWTQSAGTEWLAGGATALLKVPSAILPATNFLLNPAHPDAARLEIAEVIRVSHDRRILRLLSKD
ncbi:RES family NAD+ phosphorylase [Caballeronia sp. M23-90]